MDIQAVREGLRDAASAITGLRCFDYVPDTISPPTFFVADEDVEFDRAMGRGLDEVTFQCLVLVSRADDRSGQKRLTPYLAGSGAQSIKAALEAARGAPGELAMDGAASDLRVERARGHQVSQVGDVDYWSATFTVRVWGAGA